MGQIIYREYIVFRGSNISCSLASGEQGKMGETGCEIICGAPKTLTVKEKMRWDAGIVEEPINQENN